MPLLHSDQDLGPKMGSSPLQKGPDLRFPSKADTPLRDHMKTFDPLQGSTGSRSDQDVSVTRALGVMTKRKSHLFGALERGRG